jgi:hypothetical protein
LREVVEPFCQRGFNVILLNSRGVGGSTGRASFTGLPEAEDLKEVVKWLMENQFPALEELVLLVRLLDLCSRGVYIEEFYNTPFTGIFTRMHTNITFQTLTSAYQNPICPPFLSVDRAPFYYPLQSQDARNSTDLSGQRVSRHSPFFILTGSVADVGPVR